MNKTIQAQKATVSIRNYTLDAMKLILSVFVVMIHAEVKIGVFQPFLRMEVPLFFQKNQHLRRQSEAPGAE